MRTQTLRRAFLVIGISLAAAVSLVAFRVSSAATVREVASGSYSAPFNGIGAEGEDMIWVGLAGDDSAEMTIRLLHDGKPIDMSQPRWDVDGFVFVSGEPSRSFAAEVEGFVDWKRGEMRLHGSVTVGYMKGAAFEQTARIDDLDLRGEWRISQRVALH